MELTRNETTQLFLIEHMYNRPIKALVFVKLTYLKKFP